MLLCSDVSVIFVGFLDVMENVERIYGTIHICDVCNKLGEVDFSRLHTELDSKDVELDLIIIWEEKGICLLFSYEGSYLFITRF